MTDKEKQQLAKQILSYEQNIDSVLVQDKVVQSNKDKIENIVKSLSLEDFFELDAFIMSK